MLFDDVTEFAGDKTYRVFRRGWDSTVDQLQILMTGDAIRWKNYKAPCMCEHVSDDDRRAADWLAIPVGGVRFSDAVVAMQSGDAAKRLFWNDVSIALVVSGHDGYYWSKGINFMQCHDNGYVRMWDPKMDDLLGEDWVVLSPNTIFRVPSSPDTELVFSGYRFKTQPGLIEAASPPLKE